MEKERATMTRATMNTFTLPSSAAPGFHRLKMTRATMNKRLGQHACVAREVSVERRGMGERGCARRLGGWWWWSPKGKRGRWRVPR